MAILLVGSSEGESDSPKAVHASEILAKIERGDSIEYDDVIVKEDVDLRGRSLEILRSSAAGCAAVT